MATKNAQLSLKDLERIAERILKLSEADETEVDVGADHRRAHALCQQHDSPERRRALARHLRSRRRRRPHRPRHHQQDGRRIAAPCRRRRRHAWRATSLRIRSSAHARQAEVSEGFAIFLRNRREPRPRTAPKPSRASAKWPTRPSRPPREFFPAANRAVRDGQFTGLFAHYEQTRAEFSVTILEANSSGWAKSNSPDIRKIDPEELAENASRKRPQARASRAKFPPAATPRS